MADIRILLTDKTIAQLPNPNDGWYLARDTELKGFFCRSRKAEKDLHGAGRSQTGRKARIICPSFDWRHARYIDANCTRNRERVFSSD
jgi:hypothetical protein